MCIIHLRTVFMDVCFILFLYFAWLHLYACVAYMWMRMPSSPRSIVEDPSGRAIPYFVPDVVWGLAMWRHNNIQKKSCSVGFSVFTTQKDRKKGKRPKQNKKQQWELEVHHLVPSLISDHRTNFQRDLTECPIIFCHKIKPHSKQNPRTDK